MAVFRPYDLKLQWLDPSNGQPLHKLCNLIGSILCHTPRIDLQHIIPWQEASRRGR
jgi:hypothetical protein